MQSFHSATKTPLAFFLRAKAWQLFLLNTAPALLVLAFVPQTGFTPVILVLALTICAVPWLMWLHTLGATLGRVTQKVLRPHIAYFSFNIVYSLVFLLGFAFLLAEIFRRGSVGAEFSLVLGLAIPAQLYAAFAIYHSVYYVARRLTIVELQRNASMGEALQNFVLMFFFPIGVWITQPKIRGLFARLR